MFRLACVAITAGLLLSPDVHTGSQLQAPTDDQQKIPSDQKVPVMPSFDPSLDEGSGSGGQDTDAAPPIRMDTKLKDQSKLLLIRNVSGEFVRMSSPLPGGKQGFHLKAFDAVDQDALHRAIISSGAAVYTGDKAQITKIEFRNGEIALDVNGGGKGHQSWRDRVQLSMGTPYPQMSTTTTPEDAPVVVQQKPGATLYLDFGRELPDMTTEQFKHLLTGIFDFSKERSASVQWTETLPPKMRQAIADKRPVVGMDHDEVLAALGRPDRKVRERDSEGNDTEDWIYGTPPAPTIFVRFEGEKVIQIDKYPR